MMREVLRAALARLGYRVSRTGAINRFDAMADALAHLHARGFRPRVILDVGANVGQWARLATATFPDAALHLVEPQASCAAAVDAVAQALPRAKVYHVAVTAPEVARVGLVGGGQASTGAWIPSPADDVPADETCAATTLDELFAAEVHPSDRALLKIDVEGHEMPALEGAVRLLERVEVIVVELRFFEVRGGVRPTFVEVVSWLRERGFELYDLASLSARPSDRRLRMGDAVLVRRDSPLVADASWS